MAVLFTGPFLLWWCDSARKQRVGPGFRHLPGVFSRFAFYSGRCLRSGRTCDLVGTAEEDAHKGVFHGGHLFGLASQCFNLETAVVRFTSKQEPVWPHASALPSPPPAAREHLGPVSGFSKSFELFAVFFVANVSHDAVPELPKSVIPLGIVGARRHKCVRQAALNPASAAIAFRGRMAISLRSEAQHPQGEPQARGLCALIQKMPAPESRSRIPFPNPVPEPVRAGQTPKAREMSRRHFRGNGNPGLRCARRGWRSGQLIG